jgi:hypothetical protein
MLGVIAPTHQLPAKPPSEMVAMLRRMASTISQSLGAPRDK